MKESSATRSTAFTIKRAPDTEFLTQIRPHGRARQPIVGRMSATDSTSELPRHRHRGGQPINGKPAAIDDKGGGKPPARVKCVLSIPRPVGQPNLNVRS